MSFVKEFRDFAMRGNVLDMAIGIIIGAAFGKIVSSLVNDLLMPPLGMLMGQVNFASLFVPLDGSDHPSLEAAKEAGAPTLNYGVFLQSVLDFVLVALAIFVIIRQVNRFKKPVAAPEAPATKECGFCASSIPARAVRCPNCTSQLAA
jgi:large conductance mechanosensitive channel